MNQLKNKIVQYNSLKESTLLDKMCSNYHCNIDTFFTLTQRLKYMSVKLCLK